MDGKCHCGAVRVDFVTEQAANDLAVRTCQCTFCRKHGARTVTDPEGRLTVRFAREDAVRRYGFGPRTAEFLLCAECGVYLCAVAEVEGLHYATLNINVMDDRAAFSENDQPVVLDGETVDERIARRARAWTPARIVVGPE